MPNLQLSEADRERLSAPELLPFDVRGITNREAIEIAKLGYKTPYLFRKALVDDEDGLDAVVWTALMWLSLHRAGIDVDIRTLEFDLDRMRVIADEPDEEEAPPEEPTTGKAPGRSRSSARTNSTSGGTSRARSGSRSSRS